MIRGVPDYLKGERRITAFLKSSLFYAAAGHDWNPILFFNTMISRFVYVDFMTSRMEAVRLLCTHIPGYSCANKIYDVPPEDLFGMSLDELKTRKEFCRTPSGNIENRFILTIAHKSNIDNPMSKKLEIVYIHFEAIAAYIELFVKRAINPKCLAHIEPGMGPRDFVNILPKVMCANKAKFPKFILTSDKNFMNDLSASGRPDQKYDLQKNFRRDHPGDWRGELFSLRSRTKPKQKKD